MFRFINFRRNSITIHHTLKLEKHLLKFKGKYIGFDLDFILCTLPKIKNIHKILANRTIVLTQELLDYIISKKDTERTDLRFRYAYNLLGQLSQTIKLILIPETKQQEVFTDFLINHNLSTTNQTDRRVAYYKFFEQHIPHPSEFTFFTCNSNTKKLAQKLKFNKTVYYTGNNS